MKFPWAIILLNNQIKQRKWMFPCDKKSIESMESEISYLKTIEEESAKLEAFAKHNNVEKQITTLEQDIAALYGEAPETW